VKEREKPAVTNTIPFVDEDSSIGIRKGLSKVDITTHHAKGAEGVKRKPDDVKRKVVPNTPEYWAKWSNIQVDDDDTSQDERTEDKEKPKTTRIDCVSKLPSPDDPLPKDMAKQDVEYFAAQERIKGNEAFRSKDYDEAVSYFIYVLQLQTVS
jgi:hypothetical protein